MTAASKFTIYIDPSIEHERLDALRAKGHTIVSLQLDPSADLILSPVAHLWLPIMWEKAAYIEAALKAVRARRKGR